MKRRSSGGGNRKEKMILVASGVMVLAAMTVTGIYIHNSNQTKEPENNIVDFSALENGASGQEGQLAPAGNKSAENLTSGEDGGELDYDPYYAQKDAQENAADGAQANGSGQAADGSGQAAGSQSGENMQNAAGTNQTGNSMASEGTDMQNGGSSTGYATMQKDADGTVTAQGNTAAGDGAAASGNGAIASGNGATASGNGAASGSPASDNTISDNPASDNTASATAGAAGGVVANTSTEEANLHFSTEDKLEWPITGNVLLNYSMDKTIYFPTLQQYKYNPSIVIAAAQGTSIASASDGVVKEVCQDAKTGTTVVMNLGDGYELTYGQLQDVSVEEGDFVESGVFIGKVAAPTKYYTVEGTNVYFKLTKDGEPVNPLDFLG